MSTAYIHWKKSSRYATRSLYPPYSHLFTLWIVCSIHNTNSSWGLEVSGHLCKGQIQIVILSCSSSWKFQSVRLCLQRPVWETLNKLLIKMSALKYFLTSSFSEIYVFKTVEISNNTMVGQSDCSLSDTRQGLHDLKRKRNLQRAVTQKLGNQASLASGPGS